MRAVPFTVDTEDGDTIEYELFDEEMEAMSALKG